MVGLPLWEVYHCYLHPSNTNDIVSAIHKTETITPLWLVFILFLLTQNHFIAALVIPFYLFIRLSDSERAKKRLAAGRPALVDSPRRVRFLSRNVSRIRNRSPTNNDLGPVVNYFEGCT
jgi:hypothetical protein